MDFDEILLEIGEFGRYQKTNYLLICLPVMFAAANSLSYVFTAGTPAYRCLIPECDDPITPQLYASWVEYAAPGTWSKNGKYTPEPCVRYSRNESFSSESRLATYETLTKATEWTQNAQCAAEMFTREHERCHDFVFDKQERTIVQEWQLTCKENVWRMPFVGTMHFAGLVVGTALFGYLADRFGRKIIFIFCIIFMALTGIAQGFAWDYNSFLIFAFLNAVGTSGVYPLAFIIGVEMVGPRKREMSSIVLNYFYAVGEAMVGVAAWLLHDWQLLQYALSVPPLIFIVYYWFVPESVRWLLARNENEKAGVIIRKAARVNKKELSTQLLANFAEEQFTRRSKKSDTDLDIKTEMKNKIWMAIKEVFHSATLIWRYLIMLYIWAINAVVYYGLSLNSTNLSGNKYLNFALVCLIEIPGYTLAWVCLRKLGRRLTLAGSMLLCAVTCVASGYVTLGANWLVITLFLIGKLGITSSFAVIYTYTAEMMPTVIRSGGVGVMSTFARFGAMLAPFVPLLGSYFEALPLLLFGTLSLSAGLLSLLLPETFRKKLPDTVAEAIALGNSKRTRDPAASTGISNQIEDTV